MTIQTRPSLTVYTTGTVTGTAGSAVIAGAGTNWITTDSNNNSVFALTGGDQFVTTTGAIPIKSLDSATQITLEAPLSASIAAGSSYRIVKYSQSATGSLVGLLTALQAQGTDAGGGPASYTIDNGTSRFKTRVAQNGDLQLAVGASGTADAALLTAIDITTTGLVTFPNGVAAKGKNLIINGNFARNQRGYASGAALAANQYAHDRWKGYSDGNTSYTYSTGTPDTPIIINSAGYLQQPIEAGNISGGPYALSWVGTSQAFIGWVPPGGTYTQTSPSTSPMVQTIPAGSAVTVFFHNGTLGTVKFEPGTVATPWEEPDPAVELIRCQRYYQTNGYLYGLANDSTHATFLWVGKVTMRATPTVSLLTTSPVIENPPFQIAYTGSGSTISGIHNINPNAFDIQINGFSGLNAANTASLVSGQMAFSAEL